MYIEIKMNAASTVQGYESIHLQYVGQHVAIRVSDVTPGDFLVWNGGATTEVVAIVQLSPKFVNVVQRSSGSTCFHSRRMKLDRLVGYSPRLSTANMGGAKLPL